MGHGGCDVGHDTVYIKNATKRYKIATASTGPDRTRSSEAGAMAVPAAVSAGAGQGKEYPGELTLYVLLTCAVAATWGPYRRLRHRHIR